MSEEPSATESCVVSALCTGDLAVLALPEALLGLMQEPQRSAYRDPRPYVVLKAWDMGTGRTRLLVRPAGEARPPALQFTTASDVQVRRAHLPVLSEDDRQALEPFRFPEETA